MCLIRVLEVGPPHLRGPSISEAYGMIVVPHMGDISAGFSLGFHVMGDCWL